MRTLYCTRLCIANPGSLQPNKVRVVCNARYLAQLIMPSLSLLALCVCALAALGRGEVVELTDLNFDELVTRGGVWFIDVYAPWWAISTRKRCTCIPLDHAQSTYQKLPCLMNRCSHCRELEPVWQEVARQLEGSVSVGKVRLSSSSGSRGYLKPTVILKDGQTDGGLM